MLGKHSALAGVIDCIADQPVMLAEIEHAECSRPFTTEGVTSIGARRVGIIAVILTEPFGALGPPLCCMASGDGHGVVGLACAAGGDDQRMAWAVPLEHFGDGLLDGGYRVGIGHRRAGDRFVRRSRGIGQHRVQREIGNAERARPFALTTVAQRPKAGNLAFDLSRVVKAGGMVQPMLRIEQCAVDVAQYDLVGLDQVEPVGGGERGEAGDVWWLITSQHSVEVRGVLVAYSGLEYAS